MTSLIQASGPHGQSAAELSIQSDDGYGGLLLARRSAAAVDGPFRLPSPRFEALLDEYDDLRRVREAARECLVGWLHAAVPAAFGPAERRRILAIKRDVFNQRDFGIVPGGLVPELTAALEAYLGLLRHEIALFEDARAEVLAEQRTAVRTLLAQPRFRLILRYASPGLWEGLERGSVPPSGEFSDEERGVALQAARCLSKANPFHLFAEVLFPAGAGARADGANEVVIDAAAVHGLEARLLPKASPERVWVCLRPCERVGGVFRFWTPAPEGGFRVVSVRASPGLEKLAALLEAERRRTGQPAMTRAACLACLGEDLPSDQRDRAGVYLEALIRCGAAGAYLVRDLDRFADALSGIDPSSDAEVGRLGSAHLARMGIRTLGRLHDELLAAPGVGTAPFFVNRYGRRATRAHAAAASEVRTDLAAMAPWFVVEHNFSAGARALRGFLSRALRARGGRALYLELLRDFLGEGATAATPPDDAEAGSEWRERCRARSGRLDAEDLRSLAPPRKSERPSLCFNGPFDRVKRTFYISNVWAGGGRFAGRYLLHRRTIARTPSTNPGVLDVELAPPPPPNLHYVVRTFPTGCGFDPRSAHRFERWICPSEILVEADEQGGARFRHATTGEHLRFHYRGFLLAEYLPPEYQLLHSGEGDTYNNPFGVGFSPSGQSQVHHVPGLAYESVCLRRELWDVPIQLLADTLTERDPLRLAAGIRDRVRALASPETELWYYQVPGAGHKPGFLDLRNPLSAQLFRRAAAAAPPGTSARLTIMAPPPKHLFPGPRGRHVAELMIEV